MGASWLEPQDGVQVAVLTRNGKLESAHQGVVVVSDFAGQNLFERGNGEAIVFPRSTLKPIQTIASLKMGATPSSDHLALSTSSHCGSRDHRGLVQDFLNTYGLDESSLKCPEDWPLGIQERAELIAQGDGPSRLAMNCSGKHAGFLATSIQMGLPTDTYLDSSHPLQLTISETIAEYSGERPSMTTVDGCGAPLHAISMRGLSKAIAKIASRKTRPEKDLVDAVVEHPWIVDGHGRNNTVTIETLGNIAKIGAEGLVVIGTSEGVAVAVKIIDGSMRATSLVAVEALKLVGAISDGDHERLCDILKFDVWGGSMISGGLEVSL